MEDRAIASAERTARSLMIRNTLVTGLAAFFAIADDPWVGVVNVCFELLPSIFWPDLNGALPNGAGRLLSRVPRL